MAVLISDKADFRTSSYYKGECHNNTERISPQGRHNDLKCTIIKKVESIKIHEKIDMAEKCCRQIPQL